MQVKTINPEPQKPDVVITLTWEEAKALKRGLDGDVNPAYTTGHAAKAGVCPTNEEVRIVCTQISSKMQLDLNLYW